MLDLYATDVTSKIDIPYANEGIQAGFPSPAQNYINESIDLNVELIKHPASTFFGKVSGDSMIEVATKLKELKANRIFICTSFGLFCNGLQEFDKAYEAGNIHGVFTTNLVYRTPELLEKPWYFEVDMSK